MALIDMWFVHILCIYTVKLRQELLFYKVYLFMINE